MEQELSSTKGNEIISSSNESSRKMNNLGVITIVVGIALVSLAIFGIIGRMSNASFLMIKLLATALAGLALLVYGYFTVINLTKATIKIFLISLGASILFGVIAYVFIYTNSYNNTWHPDQLFGMSSFFLAWYSITTLIFLLFVFIFRLIRRK